jgi:hypothetical protein
LTALVGTATAARHADGTLEARVRLVLPCRHTVEIKRAWLRADGTFSGILGCATDRCRKPFEDVIVTIEEETRG